MKNTIFAIIAACLVLGGGWYYYNVSKYAPTTYVKETTEVTENDDDGDENTPPVSTTTTVTTTVDTTKGTVTPGAPTYTLASIASHNNASSCYSVVSGSVYDLTAWVNMHPGGKGAILSMCGHDGTDAFMGQHKGGAKFMGVLARYKIGTLTQ